MGNCQRPKDFTLNGANFQLKVARLIEIFSKRGKLSAKSSKINRDFFQLKVARLIEIFL